jgi:hypothetical protein
MRDTILALSGRVYNSINAFINYIPVTAIVSDRLPLHETKAAAAVKRIFFSSCCD